jgi:hypothetical protein
MGRAGHGAAWPARGPSFSHPSPWHSILSTQTRMGMWARMVVRLSAGRAPALQMPVQPLCARRSVCDGRRRAPRLAAEEGSSGTAAQRTIARSAPQKPGERGRAGLRLALVRPTGRPSDLSSTALPSARNNNSRQILPAQFTALHAPAVSAQARRTSDKRTCSIGCHSLAYRPWRLKNSARFSHPFFRASLRPLAAHPLHREIVMTGTGSAVACDSATWPTDSLVRLPARGKTTPSEAAPSPPRPPRSRPSDASSAPADRPCVRRVAAPV